jgi:hypothetical protein
MIRFSVKQQMLYGEALFHCSCILHGRRNIFSGASMFLPEPVESISSNEALIFTYNYYDPEYIELYCDLLL